MHSLSGRNTTTNTAYSYRTEREYMGLFQKLWGNRPSKSTAAAASYFRTLTGYAPVFTNWHGCLYESALVRSAIDVRARHISKLKADIMGTAKPKLRTRLKQSPNEWQTWGQFLYRLSTILDMQNTAFIVPVFGAYDEITGYYPVLPSQCSIIDVHGEPFLRYRFSSGETAAVELLSCGILTKFQYQDDFFGSSNAALTPTMELIHLQNQAITEAVKNSNTYRFMARINNFTKPEDLAKERKRFSRENFEADGGGILLFPNTYSDIKQLSQTSYTVDKEQAAQIQNNVYSYFGVNEDVLQSKAYGDAWQAFYEGCIEPFAIQFSDVMTKCVYTPVERTNGNGIMLTSNRLQYMSTTEKLKVASQMMDRGVFSVNEVREIFNAAPVDGGDVRTIRGEYKSTDDVQKGEEKEE